MKLQPIFAIVHQEPEGKPFLVQGTISTSHEMCCTKFDEVTFSSNPEDTIYMVELGYCDVIQASHGSVAA